MGAFIKKLLIFLFFTFITYSVFLFFWGRYMPPRFKPNLNYQTGSYGHTFTRLQEVKTFQNLDILFLGSSHTYRGFDTRIFKENGFNTFNLGSSSQTPIQTLVLIERYLDRLNPKLVIYEVYPESFSMDGVESALDIIANSRNDYNTFQMVMTINHFKVYNTFLYGVIRDLFKLNNKFKEPVKNGSDTYIPGGFVEKGISYYNPVAIPKDSIVFNSDQLLAFNKIVGMLNQKRIKYILVYAPIPPSNYNHYTNNKYFDSAIGRYSTYYNFNELLYLEDSLHFYDSHHLNQYGVEIFNQKLIDMLLEKY